MLENEGHWLKLMRNALVPTDANICLRITGGEILCTVTKDVNKEVELKVTCRIGDQELGDKFADQQHQPLCGLLNGQEDDCGLSPDKENEIEGMLNFATEEVSNTSQDMTTNVLKKKLRDSPVENSDGESNFDAEEMEDEFRSTVKREAPSIGEKQSETTRHSDSETTDTVRRNSESEQQKLPSEEVATYKCPLCSFQSTERKAFERHVQTHRSPSFKRASTCVTNAQSFCDACCIQFMSVDTYQVHKKYYCKTRHDREDPTVSPPQTVHSPVGVPGAFKPSPDTVILRSGAVDGSASLIQPQAIYAAISTNPLILLPCSLVSGEGLVAQNGIIATGGPGIVLQSGIACPSIVEKPSALAKVKDESLPTRKTSHPIMNFNAADHSEKALGSSSNLRKRKMSEGDVLNLKKTFTADSAPECSSRAAKSPMDDQSLPLDLSLKKRKVSSVQFNSSKRKCSSASAAESSSSISVGDCSSSPKLNLLSTSGGIGSPSHSQSNDGIQCYNSQSSIVVLKPQKTLSERVSPSPPILQADLSMDKTVLPPGLPPPKLLKQGNNVCEECNIVFYKYDNYMAHKKHYCAYRRQQLSALAAAAAAAASSTASGQEQSSDDNNSNHSSMADTVQSFPLEESTKPVLRRVDAAEHFRTVITKPSQSSFVCDACGVKYSSLDTLNAHQTYYCAKRADSAMSKYVKSRGENSSSPSNLEPPFSGPEEWKCNYCEATCSSYETIRRHLLTHNELRGFRCLICGYKGNTLRGMRTHACEHLNDNATSVEEFMSSTIISENGAMPSNHRVLEYSDEESSTSRDHKRYSNSRERTISDSHRERIDDRNTTERSDSADLSCSPKTSNSSHKSRESTAIKTEHRESSPETTAGSHRDSVNPLAFCDVVIKTENEQSSSGDESQEEIPKPLIKSEPELDPDSESDSSDLMQSESPPVQPISVIRCASDKSKDLNPEPIAIPKKRGRSQTKTTELKYCKSCDISFYHMSNFVAHKKYYCSRTVPNGHQETTTVQ